GPGNRPDRRAAAELDLDRRAVVDRGRSRAPAQRPDRRGVHDPGPGAGRGAGSLDEAARARRRLDRPRARGPLRGRPRGGGGGRRGRRGYPDADAAGRRRFSARRGRAGRPGEQDRPARHGLLRDAAGRERGQPHRPRLGLRVRGRDGRGPRPRQRERSPHRLHDREQRGRRHRRHRRRRARAAASRRRLAALGGPRSLTSPTLAERLADLAVGIGANVQPGQIVTIGADIGLEEVVREVARRAYREGAKFVDVTYFDPGVKRARIEHADADTLEFVPPWYAKRVFELGRCHSARVVIAAPSNPRALEGLDPGRLGRDQLPAIAEWMDVLSERTVNWTIIPYPTLN